MEKTIASSLSVTKILLIQCIMGELVVLTETRMELGANQKMYFRI